MAHVARVKTLASFLDLASTLVWSPLIVLLLGTGLFLTLRLGFIQLRGFLHAFYLAFIVRKEPGAEGDINHFEALMTALAATVGTGNIVGVATAITAGGPGALFWMWLTGLVGMATKYAEAVLAVHFRTKDAMGRMAGGPMYYLRDGLKSSFLAATFAVFASVAAFGIGNMVQANAVADAVVPLLAKGTSEMWVAGTVALLTGLVVMGGIRSIGRVTGLLVPVMIVLYLGGGIWVLVLRAEHLPAAFSLILREAFNPSAAVGGIFGFAILQTMKMGVARGIFSNESGLGSAPIAAAAAQTNDPVRQALVSMTQTFIDTLLVCTITGLVIVVSGLHLDPALKLNGLALTQAAFDSALPGSGYVATFGIMLFAFSTILGWYYYGERSVYFLVGRVAIRPYQVAWVVAVFFGALAKLETVWAFSDVMNGLMAFPNLIALIGLSGIVAAETKRYFAARSK